MSTEHEGITHTTMTPYQNAIVDIACLAMAIDGEVSQVEAEQISHYLSTLLEVDEDISTLLIDNSLSRLQQTTVDVFLEDIERKLDGSEQREQALTAALMAGFADGIITVEEEGLFFQLAQIFGFDEADMRKIVLRAEHFYNQFAKALNAPVN